MLDLDICRRCIFPKVPEWTDSFPIHCPAKYPPLGEGFRVCLEEDPPKNCHKKLEHAVALTMKNSGKEIL
jgi:hypothetical protein